MLTMGSCSDMMFSGHTALTYLTCPPNYRVIVVPVIMTLLVLVEYHYMSDVFVAVLISMLIEFWFPFDEKPRDLRKSSPAPDLEEGGQLKEQSVFGRDRGGLSIDSPLIDAEQILQASEIESSLIDNQDSYTAPQL